MNSSANSSLKNNKPSLVDQEWSKIICNAKIGECHKVSMATMESVRLHQPKKLNTSNISANELNSIHKQDPFMYYSIPGVRSARMLMQDVDMSNLGASVFRGPPALETEDDDETTTRGSQFVVTRSSCISFECHPDLLLESIIADVFDDFEGLPWGGTERTHCRYLCVHIVIDNCVYRCTYLGAEVSRRQQFSFV